MRYRSMNTNTEMSRRDFVKVAGASAAAATAMSIGMPALGQGKPPEVETNLGDFLKVPKTKHSLPGPFPGRVVQVVDRRSLVGDTFDAKVIREMVTSGIRKLTGKDLNDSFRLFFEPSDIVGLKVNPVGPPLINTRHEVADAVIGWLADCGLPRRNIVIWDRFDYMLKDAGFTPDRFPGIHIEGLQTMDENGNRWRDASGNHVSIENFDKDVYVFAKGVVGKNVQGYKDDEFYLNQHVYNGEYSYFGKLLTKKLTKIVNLAAFKNTGQAVSMATKSIGFGSLCNVGRLHAPLYLRTNTIVHAAPVIRDKLVLNIIDALRGQYDGGPDKNEQFVYPNHSLYFATDPFALDMIGHRHLAAKRKEMGGTVNEHPRYTEYLSYAQQLGLGVVDKIDFVKVEA